MYLLKSENSIYYQCGYSCDNAVVLVADGSSVFFTDSRYQFEAKKFCNKNTDVVINGNIIEALINTIKKLKIKKLTLDPNEWVVNDFYSLKNNLPTVSFNLEPDFLLLKRAIKIHYKKLQMLCKIYCDVLNSNKLKLHKK